MHPTAEQVAAYLGQPGDPKILVLAQTHLPIATAMVKAYTRDRGFTTTGEPGEDLAAVIVSCTARALSNPTHDAAASIDDFTIRQGIFNGWTLPELAILHRHRIRAQ